MYNRGTSINSIHPFNDSIRHPLEASSSHDDLFTTSPLEQSYKDHSGNLKADVINVQVKDDEDKGTEVKLVPQ